MDYSFSIAVNLTMTEDELLELVSSEIGGTERDKGYVKIDPNVLKISENVSFDSNRCNDQQNGWEFYRYECEVFPSGKTDSSIQAKLASSLIQLFESAGAETYLLAEFELKS